MSLADQHPELPSGCVHRIEAAVAALERLEKAVAQARRRAGCDLPRALEIEHMRARAALLGYTVQYGEVTHVTPL